MNNDELRQELLQLQNQLKSNISKTAAERDMVGHLMTDIVNLANQPDAETDAQLIDKLEAWQSEYEAEHPQISGIVRQLVDVLQRMGI